MSSSEEKSDVENDVSESEKTEGSVSEQEESSSSNEAKSNSGNKKIPLPSRSARLQRSASEESTELTGKGNASRTKREAASRVSSYVSADQPVSDESIEEPESDTFEVESSEEEEWGAEADSGSDFESEMKSKTKGKKAAPQKRSARPTRSSARRTASSKKKANLSDESAGEEEYVPRPSKRRQTGPARGQKAVMAQASDSNESE